MERATVRSPFSFSSSIFPHFLRTFSALRCFDPRLFPVSIFLPLLASLLSVFLLPDLSFVCFLRRPTCHELCLCSSCRHAGISTRFAIVSAFSSIRDHELLRSSKFTIWHFYVPKLFLFFIFFSIPLYLTKNTLNY